MLTLFTKGKKSISEPNTLRDSCLKVLRDQSYSKLALSVSYSSYIFRDTLSQWKEESTVSSRAVPNGLDKILQINILAQVIS